MVCKVIGENRELAGHRKRRREAVGLWIDSKHGLNLAAERIHDY